MNQGQKNWKDISVRILKTKKEIDSTKSFLVDEIKNALNRLEDFDIEFLNAVGLFNYQKLVSLNELEYMLQRLDGKIESLVPFCTGLCSAFSTTIGNGGSKECGLFLNIVKRNELKEIMEQIVQSILSSIASNPKSIPSDKNKISAEVISSILVCAGGKFDFVGPFAYGDELFKSIKENLKRIQPDSEILNLSEQLRKLREIKETDPKTLFTIRFSDKSINLIQRGVFYSRIAKKHPNRCRINEAFEATGISENDIMLLSMFCFAQTQEKDENRNFWPQFQQWFGFNEELFKLNSLRNSCIKAFENIESLKENGSTFYVQTALMHSVVSNRPMSVQKMYKAFEKLFRRNGYVGHTVEDAEFLITDMMESSSLNIPLETRNAYAFNPDQTVRFLINQYGYYETSILELLGYEPIMVDAIDRFAITDYIDQRIEELRQDETKTKELEASAKDGRNKAAKYHSPYVTIEEKTENWELSICFGYYNLNDEGLRDAESAIIVVDDKSVATLEIFKDKDNGEKEIVGEKIALDPKWIGKRVSLRVGTEEIDAVTVQKNLLFDFSTHRLVSHRMMKSCRHYLLVANPLSFVFDDASDVGHSSLSGMNVYDIVLDENNFILLSEGIVGISNTAIRNFFDTDGTVVDTSVVSPNGTYMPIRKKWPRINLIVNPNDEIVVNVNGRSVQYSEETIFELKDGSGRYYKKLIVCEPFPNIKEVSISVSTGGSKLLQEKFYAMKNFSYTLDQSIYKTNDKIVVEEMNFEDMRIAFGQKHYSFPSSYETLKFKLFDGNAIVIAPPMFKFTFCNGDDIVKNMNSSAFTNKELLSNCNPSLEKDMKIWLEKDGEVCGYLRKRKAGIWDSSAIMISNKDRPGKFKLVCQSLGVIYVICNVYFYPTATNQSIMSYSNRSIKTGREDGIYYHCQLFGYSDMKKLSFRLKDSGGTVVDEFTAESSDIDKRLPDSLQAGTYFLVPVEQRKTLRSTFGEKNYNIQDPVVFKGIPINGDLTINVTSAIISDEQNPRNIERLELAFKGKLKRRPFEGLVLEMDASFHIKNQFADRYVKLRVNPFSVTICHIGEETVDIKVLDVEGKNLRIDERNFPNPERPVGTVKNVKYLSGTYQIKENKK